MKTAFCLLTLVIVGLLQVKAQELPSEQWHQGEVVLLDQSVREGVLKYDLDRQAVQIRVNDKTETYDASQLISFRFLQRSINAIRRFYSLPYETQSGYKRPIFFEIIVEGKMSLLAREYEVLTSTTSSGYNRRRYMDPYYNPTFPTSRRYLAYKIYFVSENGRIVESSNKMNDIIGYFDADRSVLKKYIKKEKLKLDRIADVAKLVQHYNNDLS